MYCFAPETSSFSPRLISVKYSSKLYHDHDDKTKQTDQEFNCSETKTSFTSHFLIYVIFVGDISASNLNELILQIFVK